jgi:hypothetical protein
MRVPMRDWLLAGCVYIPAFILARMAVDHGFDPLFVGWLSGGVAVFVVVIGTWISCTGGRR